MLEIQRSPDKLSSGRQSSKIPGKILLFFAAILLCVSSAALAPFPSRSAAINSREQGLAKEFQGVLKHFKQNESRGQWIRKNQAVEISCENIFKPEFPGSRCYEITGRNLTAFYRFSPYYTFFSNLRNDNLTLQGMRVEFKPEGGEVLADLNILKTVTSRFLGREIAVSPGGGNKDFPSDIRWLPVFEWEDSNRDLSTEDVAYLYAEGPAIGFVLIGSPELAEIQGFWNKADQLDDFARNRLLELNLDARACNEAGMNDCKKTLQAVRWQNEKETYRALLAALNKLRNTNHLSKKYPALAYWVDRLTGLWISQRRMSWWTKQPARYLSDPFKSDPKIKDLKKQRVRISLIKCNTFGVFYYRDVLYHLALHHSNTFWGQEAYVELSSIGWNSGDPVDSSLNPSLAKAVVRNGEVFLARHPRSLFYKNILFDVAEAYQTIWNESGDGTPGHPNNMEISKKQAETARLKAIRYYEEFLKRGGGIKNLSPYQIFAMEICRGCSYPEWIDVKENLKDLSKKKKEPGLIWRYFHLECE